MSLFFLVLDYAIIYLLSLNYSDHICTCYYQIMWATFWQYFDCYMLSKLEQEVESLRLIKPCTRTSQPYGVLSNIIHLILPGYGIKTVLNTFIHI